MTESQFYETLRLQTDIAYIISFVSRVSGKFEQLIRQDGTYIRTGVEFDRVVSFEALESGRQDGYRTLYSHNVVTFSETVESTIYIRVHKGRLFLVAASRVEGIVQYHIFISECSQCLGIHITQKRNSYIRLFVIECRVHVMPVFIVLCEISGVESLSDSRCGKDRHCYCRYDLI